MTATNPVFALRTVSPVSFWHPNELPNPLKNPTSCLRSGSFKFLNDRAEQFNVAMAFVVTKWLKVNQFGCGCFCVSGESARNFRAMRELHVAVQLNGMCTDKKMTVRWLHLESFETATLKLWATEANNFSSYISGKLLVDLHFIVKHL